MVGVVHSLVNFYWKMVETNTWKRKSDMDKITDPLEKQLMQWLTLIRMEDKKAFLYQFFKCKFYKHRIKPPKLSNFWFEPLRHTCIKFQGHA